MSIIDSFDNTTEAIIDPSKFPPIEGFPEVAVVCFGEHVITALQEQYNPVRIGEMVVCITVPIYQIEYKGVNIALYCSTLGGPASVGLMEEMISKGCKKFVFFGSCGVLDPKITEKSLIVPTAAYRDEGTSYHYMPPSEYVEIPTAPQLEAVLSELNVPYMSGKTWTTDAFYRETRGNIEKRKKDGCLTVEMECASLMAAATFRHIPVYQFLYAADSIGGAQWDARTLGSLPQDARERFLRIALEIAVRI